MRRRFSVWRSRPDAASSSRPRTTNRRFASRSSRRSSRSRRDLLPDRERATLRAASVPGAPVARRSRGCRCRSSAAAAVPTHAQWRRTRIRVRLQLKLNPPTRNGRSRGGHTVARVSLASAGARRRLQAAPPLYGPIALYGGRIDPGKGCEELIQYFSEYVKDGGDATLALMGVKLMPLPEEPFIRFGRPAV